MTDFASEGEDSGISCFSRSILVLLLASNHFYVLYISCLNSFRCSNTNMSRLSWSQAPKYVNIIHGAVASVADTTRTVSTGNLGDHDVRTSTSTGHNWSFK